MKTGKTDFPQLHIKIKRIRWEEREDKVDPRSTTKSECNPPMENNHNFRGSCKERMTQLPQQVYSAQESHVPRKHTSRTSGSEDHWLALAYC